MMNTKLLLAGLAAGVAGFLLGWVIFGMLLMGYYEANTAHYEGLMKTEEQMNMLAIFLSNLLMGGLIAWCCARMNVTTLMGGLMTGGIIGALVYGSMGLMFLAMMNWYTSSTVVIVDMLSNGVWCAGMGAVAALVLGRGAKAA